MEEIERASFTGTTVYGVEGRGWPLRQQWANPQRRKQILFAARSVEAEPSLIGFSDSPHRRRDQTIGRGQRGTPAQRQKRARIAAESCTATVAVWMREPWLRPWPRART